ncbi:MAG: hypothetical protein ACR2F6_17445 [Mycobacteriales bacterium]
MRQSRWPVAISDDDFAPYLTGLPLATIELFDAYVAIARQTGSLTFELQNGPIVLVGSRRVFAAVTPGADGLRGHLVLTRRESDRGFRVEPLTKELFMHSFTITSSRQLDAGFAALIDEAHEVGDGAHLRP